MFLFATLKKYQAPKEKDGSFYVLKYIRTLIVPDVILKAIGNNLTSTYLNASTTHNSNKRKLIMLKRIEEISHVAMIFFVNNIATI